MNDEFYMRRALELSLKGNPSPNPYVGAVLVKDGEVIGEGYHQNAGMPHAEYEALKGVDARETTLYVTLEPCSHYGRTPPCTKVIIDAGVAEVVYAVDDPTEKVKGREKLEAAGIKVRSGILREECGKANEVFIKYSKTGKPFVVLKAAMTLDGQIATKTGESRWITAEESRKIVHELRNRYDAVLVGINTVLKDNPQLTCRIDGGRNPLRIILDSELQIPLDANVLKDRNVLVATTKKCDKKKKAELEKKADVLVVGEDKVDLKKLMARLGRRGITSVLIEGGGTVNYGAMKKGIVDKLLFFMAPKVMLGENTPAFKGEGIVKLDDATAVEVTSFEKVGPDMLIEAYPLNSHLT